jgi:2-isopropylmalate synthase
VLGKLSGRNAFRNRLKELGHEFRSESEFNDAFERFKILADKKSEIFDEDLHLIVTQSQPGRESERVRLVFLEATSRTGTRPSALVRVAIDDEVVETREVGDGPVDAVFKAIEKVVHSEGELLLYSVSNITNGTDSQGEVTVRLARGGRIVNGLGADTDIVVASAKAYISAVNRLSSAVVREHPQLFEVTP